MRFTAFLMALVLSMPAFAQQAETANPNVPHNWQLNLVEAASPIKESIEKFHGLLLYLITAIVLLVLVLLVAVVIKFRAKANPVPAKFTHNVPLEIAWTLVPALIVLFIMFPSVALIKRAGYTPPKPDLTLKVTGYQWYWGYEYPDQGGINFLSNMVPEKDIKPGQYRLLETDNAVVVPVNKVVAVQVTAKDVIHSWALPAFGVKKDAVPGRLNETWFKATKIGTFYGQCSEICGTGHAYMPIQIKVVSEEDFAKWVEEAKQKFANTTVTNTTLAALESAQ